MTLLTRYLLRNNLFLLFSCLLVGTGLYVLTDLFERLDYFLDASFGFGNILWFYTLKVPFIVGQILPAVFLIALIVQVCLMAKAREMIALQSGGVSPFVFLRFVLFYGCLWALLQLMLAEGLGVEGDRLSTKIWREDVKGSSFGTTQMKRLWFIDKTYVVYLGVVDPIEETGKDFLAYKLSDDDKRLQEMVRAETFAVRGKVWHLQNATVITPETFGYETKEEMTLPLTREIKAFVAIDPDTKPTHLPVWSLAAAISHLEKSGSNVEVLKTTLHARFAYAASLVVMGVLALAIVLWRDNVYLAVGFGLVMTFIFYAFTTLFVSLGEKGVLTPVVASWLSVVLFFLAGLGFILWRTRPRFHLS